MAVFQKYVLCVKLVLLSILNGMIGYKEETDIRSVSLVESHKACHVSESVTQFVAVRRFPLSHAGMLDRIHAGVTNGNLVSVGLHELTFSSVFMILCG